MSLLLISLALASTQTWERLGPSPGGVASFDPAGTVIFDDGRRRVRIRDVQNEASVDGTAGSIATVVIDCVNRTATLMEVQDLDRAGAVIRTRPIPAIARHTTEPVPPGGPEEEQLMRMCRTPPA